MADNKREPGTTFIRAADLVKSQEQEIGAKLKQRIQKALREDATALVRGETIQVYLTEKDRVALSMVYKELGAAGYVAQYDESYPRGSDPGAKWLEIKIAKPSSNMS